MSGICSLWCVLRGVFDSRRFSARNFCKSARGRTKTYGGLFLPCLSSLPSTPGQVSLLGGTALCSLPPPATASLASALPHSQEALQVIFRVQVDVRGDADGPPPPRLRPEHLQHDHRAGDAAGVLHREVQGAPHSHYFCFPWLKTHSCLFSVACIEVRVGSWRRPGGRVCTNETPA